MRNWPQRVGKSAEATCWISFALTFLLYRVAMPRRGCEAHCASDLASGVEGEDGILFGCDGRTVARGRMKVPVFQRRQALVIDVSAKALENGLADDFSAFVDGDFDNLVAAGVGQLPGVDHWIGSRNRQSRPNFVTVVGAANEGSVGGTCLGAMT